MKNVAFVLGLVLFTTSAMASDTSSAPIRNFHEVVAGKIYRGARPQESGLEYLADLGIKTVIDLQGGDVDSFYGPLVGLLEPGESPADIETERAETQDLRMDFVSEPLSSYLTVSTVETMRIEAALLIMSEAKSQPVFVHCKGGIDRTGLVVALYRVFYEGWTPEKAHEEMLELGHGTVIHEVVNGAMDRYFYKAVGGR